LDRFDEFLEKFITEIRDLIEKTYDKDLSHRNPHYYEIQAKILIIIKATCWILSNKSYNRVYQSLDRILKILVICDEFSVLAQCMLLMYGYFSDDTVMSSNFLYAQREMEDILYICKYALYHLNSFSRKSTFQFTDYFRDDIKYPDFKANVLKIPNNAEEIAYDSNLDFNFLKGDENRTIYEENLEKTAKSENLLNSLEFCYFFQEKYGFGELQYDWTSGIENKRIFYGLLSRARFSRYHSKYEDRLQAMEFILASLQTYVALTKLYSMEKSELLNQVFVTNLDFGNVLKEILNLFYLELTPEFHTKVLMSILNILSLDDHFDFKEYMNQINNQFMFLQKLFKDCLARKMMIEGDNVVLAIKSEKMRILAEKTALNSRFLDKLLLLLKKEIKQFYLDEENNIITTQIYSMCTLLGALMEMNDSEPFLYKDRYYFLYTYKHLLILNEILWNLIPNQDLLNNYNLFEKLIDRLTKDLTLFLDFAIKPNENFLFFAKTSNWQALNLNKLAIFVEYMIKLIDSPFFRKISMRNQMVPTLARKIADSDILIKLKILLESRYHLAYIDKIFLQTITLVGDIAREIPSLIERLIEMGIIKAILMKIDQEMPRNVESIPMIIYFLNMLCLNEQGQVIELEMDSLSQIFKLLIRRDFIEVLNKSIGHNGNKCPSSMAYEFIEILNSVEKLKPRVCELVLWTFQQLKLLKQEIMRKFQSFNDFLEENPQKMASFIEENKDEILKKDTQTYLETFPLNIKEKWAFSEDGILYKDFAEVLRDYNKILQNFLRFFSRFFSANCNIIDELINGHCIDIFLELLDSPLLLFSEKTTVSHSLINCFKVFIMNIYKFDLNEKISEEIQKILTKIENSFQIKNFLLLEDFSEVLNPEIYEYYYLNKGFLDENVKIDQKSMIFLGELLALENLNEFLRIMVTSKHIHEDANISNEGLLKKLSFFLRVFLQDIQRMGLFNFKREFQFQLKVLLENDIKMREYLRKKLQLNNPLFQTLKKVFSQNMKELMESQFKQHKENPKKTNEIIEILVNFLQFCLEDNTQDLKNLKINNITNETYYSLYKIWLKTAAFHDFLQAFFEPFKKNIALHPAFTIIFARNHGFEKIMSYFTTFLQFLHQFLSDEALKSENFIMEILKKIQEYLVYIMKTLFFAQLETGFLVYFPETDIEERNEPLLEILNFITIENLQLLTNVLIEIQDLYLYVKLNLDFKPILEIPLILLIKAVKLTHHNQRKASGIKKRRFNNNFLIEELVQMGFAKERVEEAFEYIENPTVQNLTDWLLNNPASSLQKEEKNEELKTKTPELNIIMQEKIKVLKKINKEEFLIEKKRLCSQLAEDFLKKIYFLEDFDEYVYDFLKLLLEKTDFEEFRKPLSNKYLYLILRAMKKISQSLLKKFNFKIGLKGNRDLLERLKNEGEVLKEIPEYFIGLLKLNTMDLALRNLNILLPFYSKITYKLSLSEKAGFKIKPVLEIIKIAEKFLEKDDEILRYLVELPMNSMTILQEFLLKILLQAYEVLDLQEKTKDLKITSHKKLRSMPKLDEKGASSELKDFYNRLFPLIIKLLILHNNLYDKDKEKVLLINSLPMMLLKLIKTSFQLPGSKENIRLFLSKKGLQELLKIRSKDQDFARNSELLRKIFENILINDQDLIAAHYELEIKSFFLEKNSNPCISSSNYRKDVPLNEFLNLTKADNELNVEVFEEIAKRICVKTKAKSESMKISLKSESCDITRVFNQKARNPMNFNNVQSIFQPFPDNQTLIFSEKGFLLSIMSLNSIGQKETLNNNIPGKGSIRKSSRKTSKKMKKIEEEKNEKSGSKKKSKEKKSIEFEDSTIFALDYQPSDCLQGILALILDNIINQFLEDISNEEEDNRKLVFSYPFLLKLLHAILHKFPILTPYVLKYNCGKHLKKQQKIRFDFDYKEISFLSFLLRVLMPLTLDKFRHLIFEICLDTYLYCPQEALSMNNNNASEEKKSLMPFAHEIRKKVLLDLYISLEKELNLTKSQGVAKGLSPNNELLNLISFHMYLLPIRDIAKISTNWFCEKLSLNFLRLYEELFKLLSIKDIYAIENQIEFLLEPLSVLYQYLLSFILNRKGLSTCKTVLMPSNLLAKKSSLASEWEYMMNPTVFFDTSIDHSHLHIEETVSSYSDNDYSIDTFMNELYQYHSEENPEALIQPASNLNVNDQRIDEESSGSDYEEIENLEGPLAEENANIDSDNEEILMEEVESSDESEEIGEPSEPSSHEHDLDHERRGSQHRYSEHEHSEEELSSSDDNSDSESNEESESGSGSGSGSSSEENSQHERGNRRFFRDSEIEDEIEEEEDESSEDEEEEDEMIEMQSEREDMSMGMENNNRRRFLGSVNFIFRRDRLDREEGRPNRLRVRKVQERKKRTGMERSLQSIINFDYLQFDPEIQRINDKFLEILQKTYNPKKNLFECILLGKDSEPWAVSLRMRLYRKITDLEQVLFTGEELLNVPWQRNMRNHSLSITNNNNTTIMNEGVNDNHEILAHNSQRTGLNWDFLMNSTNGMVMFVAGRDTGLIDLNSGNANALNQALMSSRRPALANFGDRMNARRMAIRSFFSDLGREQQPAENEQRPNNEGREESIEEGSRDLHGLRDRLMRELSDAAGVGGVEEEEKREGLDRLSNQQLDPLFLDILQNDPSELNSNNTGLNANNELNTNTNINDNTNNNANATINTNIDINNNINTTSNINTNININNNINDNINANTNTNTNTNINANINENINLNTIPNNTINTTIDSFNNNLNINSLNIQPGSNPFDNPFFNFQNNLPISLDRQSHNMGQGPSQDIDNARFFASLAPELREEVIMGSDPAFLGTLPPEFFSEYQSLRGHSRHLPINPLMMSNDNSESFSESEVWPRPKKPLKKEKKMNIGINKDKEQLLKNSAYSKMLMVEEKILENVVNFLYVDSLAFKNFPFVLMKALMVHPMNEKKLLDCFMGLLKGDLQTQDILERDCIVSDKQKVFMNISLKILTILAVYTKHSISNYFVERIHRSLILEKSNIKELGQSALQDLIALLGNGDFYNSYVHLKLLISLISNISRKVKSINEKKTNENEKFKLEDVSVGFLCNVLNSDILDEKSLKNLNNIISVFSINKANLQEFVSQMKFLLLGICEKMNGSLEENLIALRKISQNLEISGKETEENLINRLETEIEEEHKIYRIFKIIKKLFEKCLMKSNPKKPSESIDPNKENPSSSIIEEEKDQKNPKSPLKESLENSNNAELRKTFKILISDKALNNVWINVTELLILINEVCPKSINLSNPIIHKMTPIIECFFIIYRILNDEEASFEPHRQGSHALRKYYSKKTMPEISALIHNESPEINEEHEIKNILTNREKLTFNDMFTIMCEKNKNIINMMVKQNISLLNESFSMIIKKMPKILDFDNKKNYFRSELKKLKPSYPTLRLKVRRNNVFLDSYNVIRNLRTEELRRKLVIEFINEPGVDQGGLIREFYSLLSREIFNPGYCLFKTCANNVTFQPSPQSNINDQHLNYFKYVGRIFGKALHDGYMMDAFFTRSFYKHMLGQALTIYDMEDIDPEYFKNLKWILENDISLFELTFSYESDNFGKIEIVDLLPNGRNIPVTEENKLDYVQKICYAKMAKDIQEQIKKFLEGFHELIPSTLVSIFDSRELELMISGLPDIDSKNFP